MSAISAIANPHTHASVPWVINKPFSGNANGSTHFHGSLSGNRVIITTGGTIGGDVYGGDGDGASAVSGNSVTIGGGSISGVTYGGFSNGAGNVSGNRVSINGGSSTLTYGGYSNGAGAVSGNSVTISGGSVVSVTGGMSIRFSGGNSTVSDNSVTISGGSVSMNVFGGSGSGTVLGNRVTVSGGSVSGDVYGGLGGGKAVSDNSVIIRGGSVGGNVYGGYGQGTGAVCGNSVTISGGTVGGDVYGGYGDRDDDVVSGNSVTLSHDVTIGGTIYGGDSFGDGTVSNNTLNVIGIGGRALGVKGVDHYNFYLNQAAGGVAALTLTNPVNLTGDKVGVHFLGGGPLLHAGDSFMLINKATGATNATQTVTQGFSVQYQARTGDAGGALKTTITGAGTLNPQTRSVSDGRVAGLAMVNQGGDLAVAMGPTLEKSLSAGKTQLFGKIRGSSSRYQSGEPVNLGATAMIAGVARRTRFGLLGGFVEAGQGGFSSNNSFSHAASVTGDGSTRYTGVGLLGRYDLPDNLYLDSALHAGRAQIDFSSQNLCDTNLNRCANYNSSVMYYGASLGAGTLLPITGNTSLDISSHLQWTHLNGAALTIVNDPYTFAASQSLRWRNGVRLNHVLQKNLTTWGGIAYEYEFDGKANGTAYGLPLAALSVKGGTTIAEWGLQSSLKMGKGTLNLDASLQASAGKRAGFGEQLDLDYLY